MKNSILTFNSNDIITTKENIKLVNLLVKLTIIIVVFKSTNIKGWRWLEISG